MRHQLAARSGAAILTLCCVTCGSLAQSNTRRLELGAQFSLIRQERANRFEGVRWKAGLGGRITFDVNRYFAIEAEANVFPSDTGSDIRGPAVQGLFGVKAGLRANRFGFFGKVRPGFVRFSNVSNCPGSDVRSCRISARTEPAFDFGGVVEYYP